MLEVKFDLRVNKQINKLTLANHVNHQQNPCC